MPNKLIDNDIKKALKCCSTSNCKGCPYEKENSNLFDISCIVQMTKDVINYINRLEAENERLLQKTQRPPDVDPMDFCGVLCDFAEGLIKKAKTEAYKEFAERLKAIVFNAHGKEFYKIISEHIDDLSKTLIGDE